MRNIIKILTISIILLGCNNSNKNVQELEHGMFYFNRHHSRDTLFLQSVKPYSAIRDWGLMKWKITEDSIFRFDDRGLYSYLGTDKCSYTMNFDTLTLESIRKNGIDLKTKTKKEIEKFLVIESNKKSLILVPIYDKKKQKSGRDFN